MSAKDQALLQQTLKNSTYVTQPDLAFSDHFALASVNSIKDINEAISLYRKDYREQKSHDYETIQNLAFKILEEPRILEDAESQLLSIFAVDLAKHPRLLPILETALDSPHGVIQLTAIQTLARISDDKANQLLIKGCSSPYLEVALTTCYILAQRNHPQAYSLTNSLMNKINEDGLEFFPAILAMINTPQTTKALKKFLTHSKENVRVAAILAAAQSHQFALLNDLRSLAKQHNIVQQEACAFALGEMHDESSIPILLELANSQSETVALAALKALDQLGQKSACYAIEKIGQKGNVFAIQLLKEMQADLHLLEALANQASSDHSALNASLALLRKKDPICMPYILGLLLPENPNMLLLDMYSPGKTLTAKKLVLKTNGLLRENPMAEDSSYRARLQILEECTELPEEVFLQIAEMIIDKHQSDLVPSVIQHLMMLKTDASIALLKKWQQKVGAPYVRMWSNLALLKLNEPGPWKGYLLDWIKQQKYHQLVKMKPLAGWSRKELPTPYELSSMETSQLLMDAYLTIAEQQDDEGISVILDNLVNNDLKNRYAIAGILIHSTK